MCQRCRALPAEPIQLRPDPPSSRERHGGTREETAWTNGVHIMALPRRLLWSINETAARWGCVPADIIDWSIFDQLEIAAAVSRALTDAGEMSGLMVVPADSLVRMFRRDGSVSRSVTVHRIRRRGHGGEWHRVLDPAGGLTLEAADLVLTSDAVDRFEEKHELGQRPRNHQGGVSNGIGRASTPR